LDEGAGQGIPPSVETAAATSTMHALPPEILGYVTTPWSGSVRDADIDDLRAAYAELMDRAAEYIQPMGYDQDDVLLERVVVLRDRTGGEDGEWAVPLPLLAQPADLVAALDTFRREKRSLGPCEPAEVSFSALQLTILRETDIPLPNLRVPWDAAPGDDG
jgi:hypothetical protein